MADLGNLKILLDMATTGNLKSTLDNVDRRLDNMREKASNLHLGFDDKSISALSTKIHDIVGAMQGVARGAGAKITEEMKASAEATKDSTTQIKQQVTLSDDLLALFKEMAGLLRTIADSQDKVTTSKKASAAATKQEAEEQQKLYDITRLREKAEEKSGQLATDEVAVLKQMEGIMKSLLAIDEKYKTNLAQELESRIRYGGLTKEQLGTYQAVITRMQAAMQVEQKASRQQEKTARQQKQSAKERESAAKKQAQLETTLIRIDTQLLGVDQQRLQEQTKLLLVKKQNGTITQEEATKLSALLSQEKAITAAEEKKAAAAKNTTFHFGKQASILSQINSYLATYVSVIGAANLIRSLVRITGEFEAQHVALRAILQDVAGADRIFYQLQELAVKSPFTFRNLTDYAKQLSAFSVPMNEIYDTTKRLADVSAGLGVDMSRIILAYGQIRSASFLRGQEVRQLTEAGIPVLQELAKQLKEVEGQAISVGEVFDRISARQIPFEMIEKMFNDLTSAGGKFYQMQEVLAETVKGKISNLQDAWEIMLSKVGDANSGLIKKAISTITDILQNYETFIPALKSIALGLITLKTTTDAMNVITRIRIALINKETRALILQKLAINAAFAALSAGVGVITYFSQKSRQAKDAATELSRSMDAMGEDFRKTFSTFAAGWVEVERAYEKIGKERHSAYLRSLKENEVLLPDMSEASKKLIADSNKLIAPVEKIKREISEITYYGGELDAAMVVADKRVKQLVSDGGELEAAFVTVSREMKPLISDGGELEAAIITAETKVKQLVADGGELDAAMITAHRRVKQLVSDGGELEAATVVADKKVKQLVSDGGELEAAMISIERKTKQLVANGGELEPAIIAIDRGLKALVSDGGELEAAIVVADKRTKQLVSDGGELEAAIITVDRKVKQLTSDGGELEAAVVTATGKTLPKLTNSLSNVAKSMKEVGLAGEPARKSQEDIEKQFKATQKTTEEYEAALDELYEKYPNFIDENVRQKIAVEDLAGAWDLATQNMRQYYAEQATQQAHSILQKGYDKQTNDIIEKLNAELRTGKDYQSLRDRGLLNEGAIQLIDAYAMGLKTPEELSDDMKRLINLINSTGTKIQISGSGEGAETGAKNLIDNARAQYEQATNGYRDAIKASDDTIESEFTSSQHKKVMEYLLNAGLSKDSVLAMKNDETGFETWEQWQARLREEYKKTGDENKKVIEQMFSHFGLVVNPNELTSVQQHVYDWMTSHPAPKGVSLPGLAVKPETSIPDFAESALKMMQDDAKDLARLPKEFQKTEKQSWDEYADMLDEMGDTAHAMVARRIKYLEEMSQGLYGDDVFGSQKELLKQKKKSDSDYQHWLQDQIANLRQRFQDLKEIKGWYDKLTNLGISDSDTRRFLASFNMDVPASGFDSAFDALSEQFIKYGDKNSAQDVQNFKNGRDIQKTIDSAKAIEKYTEALRDLEAQTKRLNLSGFAQELDKIIVDADSKNRQLETNWAQKAEELENAKGGWIQRYRVENERATEAEALQAWEDFYKQQTDIAKAAMDTQREYNRKVAQEQINDRASKWLEEMMKENNIDLHDMSDKSIGQMDVIISRLRALVTSNALADLIPAELLSDAEKLNITFDELLDNIQRIVDTKAGDVQVERMKKILSGVSSGLSALGLSANTGGIQDSYAKYVEKLREEDDAQKALNKAKEEYYANADKYLDDDEEFIKSLEKLRDAQQKLKEATEATGEAYSELHMSVMLAGVQAISSGMDQLGKSIAKIGGAKGDESLKSLGESMSNISNALSDAASTAAIGLQIGGVLGAVVGAGLSVIKSILSSILDGIAKAEQYNREVRIATDEWALSVTRLRNEYALLQEQLDTIFGSVGMSKMAGWLDILREQRDILNEFNTGGPYAMDGNYILNAANLGNYGLVTKDYSGLENFFGKTDEVTSLKYIVPELFNEAGGLNFEYLEEFMQSDWFEKLSDEWKAVLNNMAEANKQFEAACKEMTDYLSSIFGEAGASIADAMISSFEATGQVALETGDILSSVARRFVSDWTQAFLTKNYLSDLSNAITDVWMDSSLNMEEQVSQSLGLMRDAMMAMSDRLPEIQQFYEGLEDQFHWAEGAGEEIGDAIKTAMVEQNSSLIAGYINSMRADLSMQRNEIMRNISPAVMTISNGITEHFRTVASIDGNVSRIWSRLDLLTSSGSGVKMNTRM